ncbi:MAG: hypothetical protein HYY26_02980 [Acidobacteria bacterium]|nr:hypothetical protein [Acidobacteriota bacterium]
MRKGLWLLVLLAGVAPLAAAAAEPLLPAELGGARRVSWSEAEAMDLERLVGAQAALLREYGSQRAEQATYQSGREEWQVTLHTMPDRSAAYGAFTLLRAGGSLGLAPFGYAQGRRDREAASVGEAGARTAGGWVFYQGNYLASVAGRAPAGSLRALAKLLESRSGQQASLPTLPSYLPVEGMVAGSDRYLLGPLALGQVAPLAPGDWAGFAYGAEVEAARYRVGGREALLLLVSYPTPQIAHQRLRDWRLLFNLNGTGAAGRPLAFARRKGTLVVFVAGLPSAEAAEQLIGQVSYRPEISWSEPAEPEADENFLSSIANIFVGTGLFLLVTLGAGLAFAAIRLAIQWWLPGKVFHRAPDGGIVVLNLQQRK